MTTYNKLRVGDYEPIKLHIHQKVSVDNNKYKSDTTSTIRVMIQTTIATNDTNNNSGNVT